MAYPGSQTKITLTHDLDTTGDLQAKYITAVPREYQVPKLERLLNEISMGARNGAVDVTIDDGNAVAATGTITLTGVGSANDTVVINGVTFTAVASGATGNQWNVGGTLTISATNMAQAIVASATALVNQHVTASSLAGVVTITSTNKGVYGNTVTIAKGVDAGSVMTVSGARLTAGAAATNSVSASTFKHGV